MSYGKVVLLQVGLRVFPRCGLLRVTTPTPPLLLLLQGHNHAYERTAAQYNGTVVQRSDVFGTYSDPAAPIYIEQGTAGAVLDFTKGWMEPQPA